MKPSKRWAGGSHPRPPFRDHPNLAGTNSFQEPRLFVGTPVCPTTALSHSRCRFEREAVERVRDQHPVGVSGCSQHGHFAPGGEAHLQGGAVHGSREEVTLEPEEIGDAGEGRKKPLR